MPFQYYIDPIVHCVCIRSVGEISLYDTQNIIEKIFSDGRHRQRMHHLFDTTRSKLPIEWNFKFFSKPDNRLNQDLFRNHTKFKMAWVVADGEDFARLHQMMLSNRLSPEIVERKVFRDLAVARLWIALPDEYEIKFPDLN